MTGHPILGTGGDVTEIIGSAAEENSGQHRHQTLGDTGRQAIDLIPALAWSSGPDGGCDFNNRTWLDYTGMNAEEAAGFGWTTTFHPDDVNTVVAYWQTLLSSGEAGEIEARLRRFDGEYRWFIFRAKPLKDAAGKVVKWYGTNTDIEDRKRAEEALRESELQLRLMVDSIPALVCTMTATRRSGLRQPADTGLLRKHAGRAEELGFDGAVHSDDVAGVVAKWRHSIETGTPYDIEHRVRRVDGVFRWFRVRSMPLRNAEDRIVRW